MQREKLRERHSIVSWQWTQIRVIPNFLIIPNFSGVLHNSVLCKNLWFTTKITEFGHKYFHWIFYSLYRLLSNGVAIVCSFLIGRSLATLYEKHLAAVPGAGEFQQIIAICIVAILICNGKQSYLLVTSDSTKWSGETVPKGLTLR